MTLFSLATQEDAAIVVAMAQHALEDAALIEGAGLTDAEAQAMFESERMAN